MIDKTEVRAAVEQAIQGTDIFIVDIEISKSNTIVVELDSPGSLDIDTCAAVSRAVENDLDRDKEDFELEVGSAGLTAPFKVRGQYLKNIGNEVEVLTRDGRKLHAVLTAVGDEDFTIERAVKVKEPGAKRPVTVMEQETLAFADAKSVKYVINFK